MDILERLRIDPGKRTLGQLLQDREAAAIEIQDLRAWRHKQSEMLKQVRTYSKEKNAPENTIPADRPQAYRLGTLIRISEVCELLGLSRSTIYKYIADQIFPTPILIGVRAVRWKVEQVEAWRDARRSFSNL
jgi:prophage regulatory protein